MTQFGIAGDPAQTVTEYIEASDPETLQSRLQQAIDAISQASVITAITLAGAGDGNAFTVLLQSAPSETVTGGALASEGGIQATIAKCYMAESEDQLAIVKAALPIPPPAGGEAPYAIFDEQMAGSSKGQMFMGLTLFVVSTVPPVGLITPKVVGVKTTPQALGAGETILSFDELSDEVLFTLPAPTSIQYDGLIAALMQIVGSVTVEQDNATDVTVQVILDPLGTPAVVADILCHIGAGQTENICVVGLVAFEPVQAALKTIGLRVQSGAGSVSSARLMLTRAL